VLGGLAAAGAYTVLVDPNASSAFPQCLLKDATGLDCPGCGGLRCVHSLLTGDIAGAADHNLLAVLLLPLAAYALARWALQTTTGRELPGIPLRPWMTWVALVVLIAFGVVRNISGTPLTWLDSTA
jgi:hypothetical protein